MIKFQNDFGNISIANSVFVYLAGEAATNCFGVKGMAVRSMSDGLVHLLKRESMGKGVYIEYNADNTISIELHIAIDQGVNITTLCESITDQILYKVTKATGIGVRKIDIFVDSVIIG